MWLFGRGLSIGCGLTWDTPAARLELERGERISRIRETLPAEMDAPRVCTRSIRLLLEFLAERTTREWRHLFLTINWDFLLQREVLRFIPGKIKPIWLSDSQVFHLNGTIEDVPANAVRSPFLLPEDSYAQRTNSVEANLACNKVIWETTFVVMGMSFECETDRVLLQAINRVADDPPVRKSKWLIVNPDPGTLTAVAWRIKEAPPCATVVPICRALDRWREEGFVELGALGIFAG